MATVDFRNAYELLRRVMEQQELERHQAGSGSGPGAASSESGGYGSPQGGLLGRLIDLQEEQGRYQPRAADSPSEFSRRIQISGNSHGWTDGLKEAPRPPMMK